MPDSLVCLLDSDGHKPGTSRALNKTCWMDGWSEDEGEVSFLRQTSLMFGFTYIKVILFEVVWGVSFVFLNTSCPQSIL
jgi:hypothetical protein